MSSRVAKLGRQKKLAVLIVAIALLSCATGSNTRFQSITAEASAQLAQGDTKRSWEILETLAGEQANLVGSAEAKRLLLADAIKIHVELSEKFERQGDLGTARAILSRAVELECLDDEWSAKGGPATAGYKALLKEKREVTTRRQEQQSEVLTKTSSSVSLEIDGAKKAGSLKQFQEAELRLTVLSTKLLKEVGILSVSYLKVQHALADMYLRQSKYDEALKLYSKNAQALEALSGRYESSDKEQVWADALSKELIAKASIEEHEGKNTESEKTLRRAEKLCSRIFGKGTLHYADIEIALSTPLFLCGRSKEALDLLSDALKLYESANSGGEFSKIEEILTKEAVIRARQGEYGAALKCCDRALGIEERHPSGNRGLILGLSIQCLVRLDREEDAIRRTEEFVSLSKKGAINSTTSFQYLCGIADLWTSRNKYSQARHVYQLGLKHFEALKPTREQQAYAMACYLRLAESNFGLQRLADTVDSANQATRLLIYNRRDSIKLAGVYNGIAGLYNRDGKFDVAKQWQMKALRLCESTIGANGAPTISTLIQLSDSYRSAGDKEKATELLRVALVRCAKNPKDPEVKGLKVIATNRLKG